MDLVIQNGTVVTMNARREVLFGADVLVRGGRIARVGKLAPAPVARRTIDASGMVVIPGLVQGHIHACQTLFRNRADGLELLDWLRERIWPMEAAHDERWMRASAELTFAELIRSGSTAALDMGTVRHTDAIFETARACGFRLTSGKAMMDHGQGVPAGLRETTRESIDESLRLAREWEGAQEGRLHYAFAPRFALSCTDELLQEVARLSRERIPGSTPTPARTPPSATPCASAPGGTTSPSSTSSASPARAPASPTACGSPRRSSGSSGRPGPSVCHCPSSNLKLASGIREDPGADGGGDPRLPRRRRRRLQQQPRPVPGDAARGADHKPRAGATAMGPQVVLEMATLGGARALGLEREIGSLEEGKRADISVVDLRGEHSIPASDDVVAQLVYSGRATDVRHVVIDGQLVMRNRELLTLDLPAISAAASEQARRLAVSAA